MLSEKQFRERAKSELRQIGDQVVALCTDCDVYWKLERDIIQHNPQLNGAHSTFLDMLRGCYADAMTAHVLRLLDDDAVVSLPKVLDKLADYPQLLHDKITEREFEEDRAALQRATGHLKRLMTPHVRHYERTLPALASLHHELDMSLDLIIETVKTYYWIIAESYINLDVKVSKDPLSVFQFTWATPALTT